MFKLSINDFESSEILISSWSSLSVNVENNAASKKTSISETLESVDVKNTPSLLAMKWIFVEVEGKPLRTADRCGSELVEQLNR
ncbi:hypothetical protein WICPIJ_001096 [Wickerhamomyces pijperi]|uniref:Uncharacterized protein n=2 Tax=Wickerhamomyces TaxID=599737 RepID=A0A9P8PVY3_9ASCO|nr:hypothetical protein WICMUC_001094 [Wickerhamomyces mucosus]KAH3687940.1 hypothetical protein WICPIJ_001096 [Wickerhamomyces pijperi]